MSETNLRPVGKTLARLIAALVLPAVPVFAQPSPPITVQLFANGLQLPLGVVHAGDGSGRLFILQQTGKILVHDGAQVLAKPFLDLAALLPPPAGRARRSAASRVFSAPPSIRATRRTDSSS